MVRIYIDTCCLNRPFDDQTQDRIHLETEAILIILKHMDEKEWEWIGSEVLNYEIEQTPDQERRRRVKMIAGYIHQIIKIDTSAIQRAKQLEALGFHSFDALHLACAENGNTDIFLTTDDKLLQLANKWSTNLSVRVENPLSWLKEVLEK